MARGRSRGKRVFDEGEGRIFVEPQIDIMRRMRGRIRTPPTRVHKSKPQEVGRRACRGYFDFDSDAN